MKYLSIVVLLLTSAIVQAQDVDEFIACAQISDRVARVICLEEALDDATRQEQASDSAEQAVVDSQVSAVEDFGAATTQDVELEEAEENTERQSFFRLPRIGNIFRRDESEIVGNSPETEETENDSAQTDQVAEFGRQSRVVINENGEDELNDVVTELVMAKPDQWLVKLASGQVWRQTHPRRLNLREGDAVRIYPTGWGENFRLEAERLSGFIQVLRVE
jgi:hypothetical protein